jgi:hypothetical protein
MKSTNNFNFKWYELLSSLYFAFSIVLVLLLLYLDPVGSSPPFPVQDLRKLLILSLSMYFSYTTLFFLAQAASKRALFSRIFVFAILFISGSLIFMAVQIHKDLFITAVPLIISFYTIFISRIRMFESGVFKEKVFIKHLYNFSTIICVLIFLWVVLMGYAILRGQAPRIITVIPLDIYYLVLALILYFTTVKLKLHLYRHVYISGKSIHFDDYDFSHYFNPVNFSIVKYFIGHLDKPVHCSDLNTFLNHSVKDSNFNHKVNCAECLERNYKATLCPRYKTLYNRVHEIKLIIEALEIGTIIYPDNKMKITAEGWKLRLFHDVKVSKRTP